MGEPQMLDALKDYAHLINFTLLMAVIGWLFHISRISRTALIDKHSAELAQKRSELRERETKIANLNSRLQAKEDHYESQIRVLDHSKAFFEKLATLPGDEKVRALQLEYEMRLGELEEREKNAAEMEARLAARSERDELAQDAERVKSFKPEMLKQMLELASTVVRLSMLR